jgi:hypothetical protein
MTEGLEGFIFALIAGEINHPSLMDLGISSGLLLFFIMLGGGAL